MLWKVIKSKQNTEDRYNLKECEKKPGHKHSNNIDHRQEGEECVQGEDTIEMLLKVQYNLR